MSNNGWLRTRMTQLGSLRQFMVTIENGQLFLALNGKGHVPLVPMTDTTFSAHFPGTVLNSFEELKQRVPVR